jgi:hypothetical protein
MDDVVMEELGAQEEVSNQPGILGDGDLGCVVHGSHRSQPMDKGADPAGTLGKEPRIAGIAALKDDLQATEQHGTTPGIADLPVGDFDFYT